MREAIQLSETIKQRLEQYPEISFIEGQSFEQFLGELTRAYQNKYKELTGQEAALAASDPVRLILNSCSVLLYQGLQYIDRAGKMGLLKYSTGDFLDNLAAMKNVTRNPAQAAVAAERFYLSAIRPAAVVIPKGIRVKAGELFFATTEQADILSEKEYVDVTVHCLTPGSVGNGFLPGEINTLVDPVNYIARVENTTKSEGGADDESDEALAERIYLSPSSYSTAGPEDAYRYWVMTYSTAIQDCKIYSESPGEVDIYVILQGGEVPDKAFLAELEDYLMQDNKRPLTDLVKVKAPEQSFYNIAVTYYINQSDRDMVEAIKKRVEGALQAYIDWQQAAIARDINPSRLMYELMQTGIKWVDIKEPGFTEVTGAMVAVPAAGGISLTYGGLQDD